MKPSMSIFCRFHVALVLVRSTHAAMMTPGMSKIGGEAGAGIGGLHLDHLDPGPAWGEERVLVLELIPGVPIPKECFMY